MSEPNEISRGFRPKTHEDSDPEEEITFDDGSKRSMINMLGCGSAGCPATFQTTRKRAWHMQLRHPGEYAGPTEEMLAMSEIMKERYGKDANLGRTWTIQEINEDE